MKTIMKNLIRGSRQRKASSRCASLTRSVATPQISFEEVSMEFDFMDLERERFEEDEMILADERAFVSAVAVVLMTVVCFAILCYAVWKAVL